MSGPVRHGWNDVTRNTQVFVDEGEPVTVVTTALDLDAALDNIRQYLDEPNVEPVGTWEYDCGDPGGCDCPDHRGPFGRPTRTHAMRVEVEVRS